MGRLTRTFAEMLAFLSRGDVASKLTTEMESCLAVLEEMPEGQKATAEITLKVKFVHELGRVDVHADVKTKLPDTARFARTPFWLDQGLLSVEHPNQINMFNGPRGVADDDQDAANG